MSLRKSTRKLTQTSFFSEQAICLDDTEESESDIDCHSQGDILFIASEDESSIGLEAEEAEKVVQNSHQISSSSKKKVTIPQKKVTPSPLKKVLKIILDIQQFEYQEIRRLISQFGP
jgi:hypothetical protein